METNLTNANEDFFWQIIQPLFNTYWASTLEIIITLVTIIILIIASYRLYRKTKIVGSKLIFFSIAAYAIAYVTYSIYYNFVDDVQVLVADLTGLFLTACYAIGTYGFLLLSKHLIESNKNN